LLFSRGRALEVDGVKLSPKLLTINIWPLTTNHYQSGKVLIL
jgi:hypothetical protein